MYCLTDPALGVKVGINDRGKPVTRTEYLPYGETWLTEGEQSNAPKFNSQELDRETNFYFYNARYYDPEIARFVTEDNLVDNEADTQGWNRFSYVKGNPVVYKDPTGHLADPFSLVLGVNAAAGKYVYDSFKNGKGEKTAVENKLNESKNTRGKYRLECTCVMLESYNAKKDDGDEYKAVKGYQKLKLFNPEGKLVNEMVVGETEKGKKGEYVRWEGSVSPWPAPPGKNMDTQKMYKKKYGMDVQHVVNPNEKGIFIHYGYKSWGCIVLGNEDNKESERMYNALIAAAGKDGKGVIVDQKVVDKRDNDEKIELKVPYKTD